MTYSSFYLNILLRVILLSATNLGFFYFLINRERFFTVLTLGLLFLVQIIWMVYYINSVNRNLSRFLLLIGEEGTSFVSLRNKVEKTFSGLHHSFQKLNEQIGKARLEKEYSSVLIANIIDHVGAGIIAWNKMGEIELINDEGLKLLDCSGLERTEEIEQRHPGLISGLKSIPSGKKTVLTLEMEGRKQALVFRASEFLMGEKSIKLFSFQSIQSEIENTEMQSWEKLIRVLAHEVSNSVTPITTLGANIRKRLLSLTAKSAKPLAHKEEILSDISRSAALIEQRGNGLMDFINQYKTFMRMPQPVLQRINISQLLSDVSRLCAELDPDVKYKIVLREMPQKVFCSGDHKMLEQVLINLVRNSIQAIPPTREGIIELSVSGSTDEIIISVRDNGSGISGELIEQVFIPFFTTHKKGSGIGLSFCRRIIHMHGGQIRLQSEEKTGTRVTISLPIVLQI